MSEEKKTTPVDRLWDFLSSVKLAIIIFSLIALTSIVGTVLEQQAAPEKNLKILGDIFGENLAPTLYSVFDALGFMDMYRSWWFLSLLLVFAGNLLICSIDRFPGIWKIVRAPAKPLTDDGFKGISIKKEFTVKGKPDNVKEAAASALKSAGFSPIESKEGNGYQLYNQKWAWSRLGVFITHLSVILILIGAVIGIIFGFKGFLNLPEGEAYTVAFARTGGSYTKEELKERDILLNAVEHSTGQTSAAAGSLGVTEEHLTARMKRYGIEPLGFSIRCEDFEVSFYDKSDMPKEYSSLLTVTDGGREVIKKWIEVNDPLKYKGFTFYQSSYGMMPDVTRGYFILKITSAEGASETKRLHLSDSSAIPGSQTGFVVSDFSPAIAFDATGRPFTYSEMMNNPAIRIDLKEGGSKSTKWILKRDPRTWGLPDGSSIQFVDIWGGQYTGLQVRKDPGVWVVYFGCLTMSIGLFIAFFVNHRKVWMKIIGEKNNSKVVIGAYANKNRQAFERKIDKIAAILTRGGK